MQHKALLNQEDDSRIPVLMVGGIVRMGVVRRTEVVMMRAILRIMMMLMRVRIVGQRYLNIAGERIGEMRMVMGMVDTIHQRDIGLPRQHDRQRHADQGDDIS
jgi:hypothetical protein